MISYSRVSVIPVMATLQLKFWISTWASNLSRGSKVLLSKEMLMREVPWSKQHQLTTRYSHICIIRNSNVGGSSATINPTFDFAIMISSPSWESIMLAFIQYLIFALGLFGWVLL